MRTHREITGNDTVVNKGTIDLAIEQINDETDPLMIDAYLIYYIGCYKPFAEGNEDTAKKLADGILADAGYEIPQNDEALTHFRNGCNGEFTIDSIVEWQSKRIVKK